ncbi:uncharacterized protein EV154DRAFT_422264, partial [Mucor mucedo]|uniref:uncharacterized protein n=1 Tax=Mucor mucedo TaxID=29922 RepID=UPI00221EDEE7
STAKTKLLQKSQLFYFHASCVENWDSPKPTETFITKISQNDILSPKPIKPIGHEKVSPRVVMSSLFALLPHRHVDLDEHL